MSCVVSLELLQSENLLACTAMRDIPRPIGSGTEVEMKQKDIPAVRSDRDAFLLTSVTFSMTTIFD